MTALLPTFIPSCSELENNDNEECPKNLDQRVHDFYFTIFEPAFEEETEDFINQKVLIQETETFKKSWELVKSITGFNEEDLYFTQTDCQTSNPIRSFPIHGEKWLKMLHRKYHNGFDVPSGAKAISFELKDGDGSLHEGAII